MRYLFLIFILFITNSANAADLVVWSSPQGVQRLERSNAKTDFFPLANNFEAQENKIYCGLASSAIILNALRLDNPAIAKPQDTKLLSKEERKYLPKNFDPIFTRYTQNTLLNSHTKSKMEIFGKAININGKKIADYGLQLRQLANILSTNNLDVAIKVADNSISNNQIRKDLVSNLQNSGDYVLVNYSRKVLGQGDIGHISPLGAYDKKSDSFLILDVNPNTAKWTWVKSDDLIAAMRTFDMIENRGYLLIKEGKNKYGIRP